MTHHKLWQYSTTPSVTNGMGDSQHHLASNYQIEYLQPRQFLTHDKTEPLRVGQKGCGFAIYNVLKNKISPPYATTLDGKVNEDPKKTKGHNMPLVYGKKCADGGFETLMDLYAGAPLGGGSVRKTLTDGRNKIEQKKHFSMQTTKYIKHICKTPAIWRTRFGCFSRPLSVSPMPTSN